MSYDFESDSHGSRWLIGDYQILDNSVREINSLFLEIENQRELGNYIVGIKLKVPPALGQGSWRVTKVSKHLYVMTADVMHRTAKTVHVADDKMAKVRVLLKGELSQLNAQTTLRGTGAFLEAFPGEVRSDYVLSPGIRTQLVIVNCDPEYLTEEIGLDPASVPEPLNHVFEQVGCNSKGHVTALAPDLLRSSNDILHAYTRFSNELLNSYLNAKGQEVFCATIASLRNQSERPDFELQTSVRDISRVEEARDIVVGNLDRPPTIPQLARMAGINQTKMKALFKQLYGMTIHEFSLKCRMEHAIELLSDRSVNIAEIAHAVGYDHPASFTHAFKKHFGHTPREIRRSGMPSKT